MTAAIETAQGLLESAILSLTPVVVPGLRYTMAPHSRPIEALANCESRVVQVRFGAVDSYEGFDGESWMWHVNFSVTLRYEYSDRDSEDRDLALLSASDALAISQALCRPAGAESWAGVIAECVWTADTGLTTIATSPGSFLRRIGFEALILSE